MVIFVCQASTRSVNSSAILRRNFFKLEIPPPPGQTLAQTCAEASRNLHPQIMVVASGKLRPMEIPPQNVPSKIGFPERIKTTIMMVKPENLVFHSPTRGGISALDLPGLKRHWFLKADSLKQKFLRHQIRAPRRSLRHNWCGMC